MTGFECKEKVYYLQGLSLCFFDLHV